jgi:hypothetical protein
MKGEILMDFGVYGKGILCWHCIWIGDNGGDMMIVL